MKKRSSGRKKVKQKADRSPARVRIGLALGSGSARGWAHIGAIRALADLGISPDIVCGSSIGALVGAAHVNGRLDALEAWALSLSRSRYLRFLELRMPGGGLVKGGRLMETLAAFIPDVPIESLPLPYAAVATDLASGREVWFREGSLLDAVRASIAVPGLFTPWQVEGRLLTDGGLVNPVPVTVCRALGAHLVIAVNPFGDRLNRMNDRGRDFSPLPGQPDEEEIRLEEEDNGPALSQRTKQILSQLWSRSDKGPGMMDVLLQVLNIMQDRIIRSRLAGDPPDVLVAPRLSHIGLLEFDRAEEAIAEGRAAVKRVLPALQDMVGIPHGTPETEAPDAKG